MHSFSTQIQDCMDRLAHCHLMCLGTVMTHCLESDGPERRPQHIRLMQDCAAMCALTADLLAHKSQFHSRVCALCKEICETCAEDCARLGGMDDCVKACRETARLCGEVARMDHAEILAIASRLAPSAAR